MHSDPWIQNAQGLDEPLLLAWGEAADAQTWPLHAVSALTLGQLAQLSERATAGLRCEQIRLLSPAQVVALRHLGWISPPATVGFTPAQIAALSLDQFAALNYPDWLGPKAVASLAPAHIARLSVHWGWMSDDWIAALSPQVVPFIAPAMLSQLTPIATTGLGAAQLQAMHPGQMGALRYPQALSRAALLALNAAQRQALRGNVEAS